MDKKKKINKKKCYWANKPNMSKKAKPPNQLPV